MSATLEIREVDFLDEIEEERNPTLWVDMYPVKAIDRKIIIVPRPTNGDSVFAIGVPLTLRPVTRGWSDGMSLFRNKIGGEPIGGGAWKDKSINLEIGDRVVITWLKINWR